MYGCVLGSTSGFMRTEIGATLRSARARDDQFELRRRFDVELENVALQAEINFILCFPHAGKDGFLRISANTQHAQQFSPGYDVESGTQSAEEVQDRKVRIGLYGVANQVGDGAKSGIEHLKVALERGLAIQIKGSADLARDIRDSNIFAVQPVLFVCEILHETSKSLPGISRIARSQTRRIIHYYRV